MTHGTPSPSTGHEPALAVRRNWVLVVVLGALSTFGPLSMDMYLPSLPSIAKELQAGTSTVQLSLTACVAGLALGQLVAGPLSDSVGRRRPLLFGLAGFVVASIPTAIVFIACQKIILRGIVIPRPSVLPSDCA